MNELSWTPRRRGLIYCAPACGAGCTAAQHAHAVRLGRALARRLGRGWASGSSAHRGDPWRRVTGGAMSAPSLREIVSAKLDRIIETGDRRLAVSEYVFLRDALAADNAERAQLVAALREIATDCLALARKATSPAESREWFAIRAQARTALRAAGERA